MKITGIKIRRTYDDNRLRALVSLTLEDNFAIHDIKIIDGPQRLFVAMPSRRDEQGVFRDICHPITAEARKEMEDKILEAYNSYMNSEEAPPQA